MHRAPRLSIALGALLSFCATGPYAQTPTPLHLGYSAERALSSGTVDAYDVSLTAGDFVHVVIRKHDVDLSATLIDPGGREVVSRHSDPGEFTDEVVAAIASANGPYELRIRSLSSGRPSSRYSIEVVALRPAGPQDRDRVEAEAAIQRARSLQETGQPRTYATAEDEFTAALKLFTLLGDRRRELRTLNGLGRIQAALGHPAAFETYRRILNQFLRQVRERTRD